MRNTVIALSLGLGLGLCSLPSMAASLAEQFSLMEKGAESALDTRLFSHDGIDIKAWVDGSPVIIAVPIMNEQGKQEGESRYYFKGGKLFGVKEPAAQFAFDDGGKLTRWLDEPSLFPLADTVDVPRLAGEGVEKVRLYAVARNP